MALSNRAGSLTKSTYSLTKANQLAKVGTQLIPNSVTPAYPCLPSVNFSLTK